MKKLMEIPDKEIKLSFGDYVKIYVRENSILFSVFCNQDGCEFELTKDELRKWIE